MTNHVKIKDSLVDSFPIASVDIGNERAKAATIINPRAVEPAEDESRFFRTSLQINAVHELSRDEYEQALSETIGQNVLGLVRATGEVADSAAPKGKVMQDWYFAVGDAALPYIDDIMKQRRVKAAKFTRDHYGIQAMLALRYLFPKMPEAVHLIAGHPPLNKAKKPEIIDSLVGKWTLHFCERKCDINVLSAHVIDEITGGALNQTLKIDGTANGTALTKRGGNSLIFDLGGGTLDVVILDEKGFPVPGTFDSAQIGILTAIKAFKTAFDKEYAHLFTDSAEGVPLNRIYEIFLDPEHTLRNVGGVPKGEINCKQLFDRVMASTLRDIHQAVNDMVGNLALAASRVFITGGAGDLLYIELSNGLFKVYADNGALHRTATKGQVIYANTYGMAKFGEGLRMTHRRKESEHG